MIVVLLTITTNCNENVNYLNIGDVGDRAFDVVWAYGEEIERGQVQMTFSSSGSDRQVTMSGGCDYTGVLTHNGVMDASLEGSYNSCANARVKDTLDHWSNNRSVNNAQLYMMHLDVFYSKWVVFGDKDHQANRILPLVAQHYYDHPKFLNDAYATHVQNYPEATP